MSRPLDWAPLTDSDPVPGDQGEIQVVARRYRDFAAELEQQAAALNRLAHAEGWDAIGGRAFASTASDVAGQLTKAKGRYQGVGDALSTYATELAAAQQEADAALREAKQAEAEEKARATAAGTPEASSSAADAHSDALTGPMNRMHRAVDQKNTAGRRAASRVRDAISDDGLRDSWWDKVKNWSGKTWNSFTEWVHDNAKLFQDITKWAGRISTLLTVIGTICAVIPILNVAAPAFFALAAAATAVSFVFNVMLALSGDGSWLDVGMDAIALATFGYGKYATIGVKSASQGLKGAARTAAAEGLVKEGAAGLRELGEQAARTGTRLGPQIWQTARNTVYKMADEGADDLVKGIMPQAEGSAGLLKFADTRVGKLLGLDSEVALAADKVKALAALAPGSASVQKAVGVAENALKVKKWSDGVAAVGNKLPAVVELMDKKFDFKKNLTWGRYATQ